MAKTGNRVTFAFFQNKPFQRDYEFTPMEEKLETEEDKGLKLFR